MEHVHTVAKVAAVIAAMKGGGVSQETEDDEFAGIEQIVEEIEEEE